MNSEHGGNIYAATRSIREKEGAKWLDFSANINPLGLADSVRQAMINSIDSVIHYPDTEAYELKKVLSHQYQIPRDCITVGNGAVELFYVFCHVYRPKQVLVLAPTFSEYSRASRAAGAMISHHYLTATTDFKVDKEQLIKQLKREKPDLFFLCNPNNPTGGLLKRAEVADIVRAAAKQQCKVVIDESFLDFIADPVITCMPLLSEFDNLVIAHSLTKFYAIPGLRLGFMAASSSITERLHASKDPWNVNSIAQYAGMIALQDDRYAEKSRNFMEQEKNRFYRGLLQIKGLHPSYPSVNYILVNTAATGLSASTICKKLLKQGILVRDCSNYEGLDPFYIRLAVKLAIENDQLLRILEMIVKGDSND